MPVFTMSLIAASVGAACAKPTFSLKMASNGRQPLHHVRELRHHADQQRGLGVGLGAALLPVFKGARVGAQVVRKHGARQMQLLTHAQHVLRRQHGRGLAGNLEGAQRELAFALGFQCVKALG